MEYADLLKECLQSPFNIGNYRKFIVNFLNGTTIHEISGMRSAEFFAEYNFYVEGYALVGDYTSVCYSINYQINKENAQTIYKTVGANYYDVLMIPRIQEAVKSVIAKYTAENLIASREELSRQITDILTSDLDKYNIIVINTAIENLDFSDAFTNAVEEKQVAEQQKLKAAIEQQQLTLEAEAAAERDIVAANAESEVKRIQAEAEEYAGECEAEMNKNIAASLTPALIDYYYANAWDGKLPEIVGSDTVLPILGNMETDLAN